MRVSSFARRSGSKSGAPVAWVAGATAVVMGYLRLLPVSSNDGRPGSRTVRPRQRGVAARPRGDAAAGRGTALAAPPGGAPARRGGRPAAQRVPLGSLGSAARDTPQLPGDRLRNDG